MLRLSRREGESVSFQCGWDREGRPLSGTVTVLEFSCDGRVRLGFSLPGCLKIVRTELLAAGLGGLDGEPRKRRDEGDGKDERRD